MKRMLKAAIAAGLLCATLLIAGPADANAQVVTYYYSPTVTAYYPGTTTAYYAPAPVTTYYAPTTAYYAPTTAYYAAPTTAYYAPTTAYYAPTTAYYAPTTAYYAPVTRGQARRAMRRGNVAYYAPAYYAAPMVVGY